MVLLVIPFITSASSHREAPLISSDPQADTTDVYAFVSPDKPDTVTLIMSVNPMEEPAGGPNFHHFGDDVLYEIKIDNDGSAVEDISYQFRFKTHIMNPDTFLYNTGPITSLTDTDWNIRQTYSVTRVKGSSSTVLASDLPVAPANIGPKSTPDYEALAWAAVRSVGDGYKVFAGPTDDAFFVDLGAIFDLLTIRKLPGNKGGGVDGLQGYNVHSIAIQVPIKHLTKDGAMPDDPTDENAVIGVWGTSSRMATKVLSDMGDTPETSGDWVQVSRLGAPLVNEVVIPLGDKDKWNASVPADDAQFANYVTDPELGKLLKALYGIEAPPQGAFGSADQRDDLIAIFLTGIEGLTMPKDVVPSEQLRLNVAVPPSDDPNAMGVLGGDLAGYPNGRRLADDVTDISLRAVAGAAYPLFHPDFTPDATGVKLGDGVDENDAEFHDKFPYLAHPWQGFQSVPHGKVGAPDTGSQSTSLWWFVGAGLAAFAAGGLVLYRARRVTQVAV
ncbi:MAG: DUF4331 domain-containing protein [SAR202 cluster bacterium]|nr:DUF4331 domain-containing protein [SAR202 cluster bacterium]